MCVFLRVSDLWHEIRLNVDLSMRLQGHPESIMTVTLEPSIKMVACGFCEVESIAKTYSSSNDDDALCSSTFLTVRGLLLFERTDKPTKND